MHHFDLAFDAPCQKMTAGQFWAVVTANRPRLSALRDDLVEYARHAQPGEAGVHFQGEALQRISIHHAQHANRPARGDRIMSEVQSPFLIGRRVLAQWRTLSHAVLLLLPLQRQSCFAIHPMDALVVDLLAGVPLSLSTQTTSEPACP